MPKQSVYLLSTALAALATSSVVAADSYQWEAGLGYSQSVNDDDLKTSLIGVRGEYHFAPVQLGAHPWEEAAFLEHSTFAEAGLGLIKYSDDGLDASGLGINAGFTYATPEFPLRLSAMVTSFQAKDDDIDLKIKSTAIDVEAGYWIFPDLLAGLRLGHQIVDIGSPDDDTYLRIGAFGKWVRPINETLAFNAEAELARVGYDNGTDDNSNTALDLAGDIYCQQRYGVGVMLGTSVGDIDSDEGTTIGLRGSAWFTENIGARMSVSKFTAKDSDVGADSTDFSLEVVGRF